MTSLYIHIPFCRRKCFYCSFAVSVGQERRRDEYLDALEAEARLYAGLEIGTVYLGGGTPTELDDAQLKRLVQMIESNFRVVFGCEFTAEANPENLNPAKAEFLRSLGINRVSLGLQTFNDDHLKYLGRAHDSFKALSAFNDLRRAGFKNINVDLMYSFPGQTVEQIRGDVRTALGLGSEHVSIYTLTVEENSRFYAQKIREQDRADQGEQYELVASLLEDAGLRQYEVSNFARPGFESAHNINYWRGGNYIGLGLSSHSHHDGRRSWNTDRLSEYLRRMKSNESPEEGHEVLSAEQRLSESLVFGLRMTQGVDIAILEDRYRTRLSPERRNVITQLVAGGLLCENKSLLKATAAGRLVLDSIAARLI